MHYTLVQSYNTIRDSIILQFCNIFKRYTLSKLYYFNLTLNRWDLWGREIFSLIKLTWTLPFFFNFNGTFYCTQLHGNGIPSDFNGLNFKTNSENSLATLIKISSLFSNVLYLGLTKKKFEQ